MSSDNGFKDAEEGQMFQIQSGPVDFGFHTQRPQNILCAVSCARSLNFKSWRGKSGT